MNVSVPKDSVETLSVGVTKEVTVANLPINWSEINVGLPDVAPIQIALLKHNALKLLEVLATAHVHQDSAAVYLMVAARTLMSVSMA